MADVDATVTLMGGTFTTATASRRDFLMHAGARGVAVAGGVALAPMPLPHRLAAQGASPQSAASNVEMSADSYKPVRRQPKVNAVPSMDERQLNEFERTLACPCPCTLDVFTCRTTDFTCGISPAVHRDLQALVDGGYSADEIMGALYETYGDFILMSPRKAGFNLVAWFVPFAAVAIGAVVIAAMLRGWRRNEAVARASASANPHASADAPRGVSPGAAGQGGEGIGTQAPATAEELARLQAAIRDDRR